MSIWKYIYLHLKSKGIDVYAPGQHKGNCTSNYVVVKDTGQTQYDGLSSIRQTYDVMCYVPEDSYSTLEDYVEEVKSAMGELYPMIVPMYYQAESFLDDTVRGHMTSIQYRNNIKIEMIRRIVNGNQSGN